MTTITTNEQIIQDAREAAEAAVEQGFWTNFQLDDTELYGTAEEQYRDHAEGSEPWTADVENIDEADMDLWVSTWRERLRELAE